MPSTHSAACWSGSADDRGRVEQLHVLLSVTFRLAGQPDLSLEFVVDTGFTGFLALPVAAVMAMDLSYLQDVPANLADDSQATALPSCGTTRHKRSG